MIKYRNGHHVISRGNNEIALTDAQLADMPYRIGEYVDNLPADVRDRVDAEMDRADLENAYIEGVH
jgi:hypothetical protein